MGCKNCNIMFLQEVKQPFSLTLYPYMKSNS